MAIEGPSDGTIPLAALLYRLQRKGFDIEPFEEDGYSVQNEYVLEIFYPPDPVPAVVVIDMAERLGVRPVDLCADELVPERIN